MKHKIIHLQAPAAWVNSRHEAIQRERELDRRIRYTYATDYGEPADIDWPEIVIGTIGIYFVLIIAIIVLP